MGKGGLVALLSLSFWCIVMVVWLFLGVQWVCLRFVIVVFPDHTHLLCLVKFYLFVLKIFSGNGIMMGGMTNNPNPVKPHFFKVGLFIRDTFRVSILKILSRNNKMTDGKAKSNRAPSFQAGL